MKDRRIQAGEGENRGAVGSLMTGGQSVATGKDEQAEPVGKKLEVSSFWVG